MSETQEFRHILVIEDRKGRRIISLEDNNYTLGRDSNNPIVIYDYQVSRTHATLEKKRRRPRKHLSHSGRRLAGQKKHQRDFSKWTRHPFS